MHGMEIGAAGKKAGGKAKCWSKATGNGLAVRQCLSQRRRDEFSDAYNQHFAFPPAFLPAAPISIPVHLLPCAKAARGGSQEREAGDRDSREFEPNRHLRLVCSAPRLGGSLVGPRVKPWLAVTFVVADLYQKYVM